MDVTVVRRLTLKPNGKERPCARGALESEGGFLTPNATKHLIKLARDIVSRSSFVGTTYDPMINTIVSKTNRIRCSWQMESGCRFLVDIILLRLAAVLSTGTDSRRSKRVYIVNNYSLDSVEPYENHKYSGVIDYFLAKSPPKGSARKSDPWPS